MKCATTGQKKNVGCSPPEVAEAFRKSGNNPRDDLEVTLNSPDLRPMAVGRRPLCYFRFKRPYCRVQPQ